ncbi:MAG TPA: SRPBCC family protein [Pseudonocardiaceae bacterium]|jgi:uncharacterized protein YndB with AHSA1/START domain
MDGTLHTIDGRQLLRFERRLRHPVEKVWQAITDPAELAGWFPWQVVVDARIGGKIEFTHPQGLASAPDAVITELDPPHVFGYTWNDADLRWELTADDGGCVLVFTHVFAERPPSAKFAAGWHLSNDALASVLDGEPFDVPDGRWAELNRLYVRAFGLLDGDVVDVEDGGHELRFTQEVVQPPAAVWSLLAGSAQVGEQPPGGCVVDPVPAGPVTELRPGESIGYPWSVDGTAAGTVRISLLSQDFGTRVVLVQTVPAALADCVPSARAAWHDWLIRFADELDTLAAKR